MSLNPVLSKRNFLESCYEQCGKVVYQKDTYLDSQVDRLYKLYTICCRHLSAGDRMLSIGAGSAYLEAILSLEHGIRVEIVDFPEMIEVNQVHYRNSGFTCISRNILEIFEGEIPLKSYDLILSSEVVEHLPESPSKHISRFKQSAKFGGLFLISTPNLGRLSVLLAILAMNPILPKPEKTFDTVSFDNEGVHRREYMPGEIVRAIRSNGLSHILTSYAGKRISGNLMQRVTYSCASLVPRFKSNFICMAKVEPGDEAEGDRCLVN